MKSFLLSAFIIMALASCETPQHIQARPDNTANTSGTTGSATMTNQKASTESGTLPASGKDSTSGVRDSLPK